MEEQWREKANQFQPELQKVIGPDTIFPKCLAYILIACGFETIKSLGLDSVELNDDPMQNSLVTKIEDHINENLFPSVKSFSCATNCPCSYYKTSNSFSLPPGQKDLLFTIVNHAKRLEKEDNLDELMDDLHDDLTDDLVPKLPTNAPIGVSSKVLKSLILSEQINLERTKQGRRYSKTIRDFFTYIYLLCGRFCYSIFYHNLSVPSVRSIRRYIQHRDTVKEGVLRCQELNEYLEKINVEKKVWLSEDATGITPKLTYDPATNLIVGLQLPLDNNGCPKSSRFFAKNEASIKALTKEIKSHLVYIVMAHPLAQNVSPFLLLLFGTNSDFEHTDVLQRWRYISSQLKSYGIEVMGISSDGDPKLLKAMKHVVSDQNNHNYMVSQDIPHLGNKLLHKLVNAKTLQMGDHKASMKHLETLVKTRDITIHGLSKTDIYPKDKMNTDSFDKMIENRVVEELKEHIKDSQSTVQFLKICKDVTTSYSDLKLPPLDRVYRMARGCMSLRIWRKHLEIRGMISNHFITPNAYHCVEINYHTLISILKKLRDENKPEQFLPPIFDSQTCENTFRIFRSMGSMHYTKITFSIYELLHMVKRLDIINDLNIKLRKVGIHTGHKYKKQIMEFDLPSDQEIHTTIEKAKKDAIQDFTNLGITLTPEALSSIDVFKFDNNEEIVYDSDDDEVNLFAPESDHDGDEERDLEDPGEGLSEEPNEEPGDTSEGICEEEMDTNSEPEEIPDPETIDENSPFVWVKDENEISVLMRKSTLLWSVQDSQEKPGSKNRKKRFFTSKKDTKKTTDATTGATTSKRKKQ